MFSQENSSITKTLQAQISFFVKTNLWQNLPPFPVPAVSTILHAVNLRPPDLPDIFTTSEW